MELPVELRIAVEEELKKASTPELTKIVAELSDRYRTGRTDIYR